MNSVGQILAGAITNDVHELSTDHGIQNNSFQVLLGELVSKMLTGNSASEQPVFVAEGDSNAANDDFDYLLQDDESLELCLHALNSIALISPDFVELADSKEASLNQNVNFSSDIVSIYNSDMSNCVENLNNTLEDIGLGSASDIAEFSIIRREVVFTEAINNTERKLVSQVAREAETDNESIKMLSSVNEDVAREKNVIQQGVLPKEDSFSFPETSMNDTEQVVPIMADSKVLTMAESNVLTIAESEVLAIADSELPTIVNIEDETEIRWLTKKAVPKEANAKDSNAPLRATESLALEATSVETEWSASKSLSIASAKTKTSTIDYENNLSNTDHTNKVSISNEAITLTKANPEELAAKPQLPIQLHEIKVMQSTPAGKGTQHQREHNLTDSSLTVLESRQSIKSNIKVTEKSAIKRVIDRIPTTQNCGERLTKYADKDSDWSYSWQLVEHEYPAMEQPDMRFNVNVAHVSSVTSEGIIKQLSEHIAYGKSAEGSFISVKLKPEYLGEMSIRIEKTPKGLIANIVVENGEVKRALVDKVDELVATLAEKMIKVDNVVLTAKGEAQQLGGSINQQLTDQNMARQQGNQRSMPSFQSATGTETDISKPARTPKPYNWGQQINIYI